MECAGPFARLAAEASSAPEEAALPAPLPPSGQRPALAPEAAASAASPPGEDPGASPAIEVDGLTFSYPGLGERELLDLRSLAWGPLRGSRERR